MKKHYLLWYILILFLTIRIFPDSIYISTNGNDTTGDGSFSNPYFTLNKAEDALNSNLFTNGNCTIFIKEGRYYSNVVFDGDDYTPDKNNKLIITALSNDNTILSKCFISITNLNYVIISNLSVNNNDINDYTLKLSGNNIEILKVTFLNNYASIYIYNLSDSVIKNSYFYNNTYSISIIDNCLSNNINNNSFIINSNAVFINNSTVKFNTLSSNKFIANTGFAINISNAINNNIFSNYIKNSSGYAINILSGKSNIISNNYIYGNNQGIFLQNNDCLQNKILLNTITNNICGIKIQNADNNIIIRNNILYNLTYNIYFNNTSVIISNWATNNIISLNNVTGNTNLIYYETTNNNFNIYTNNYFGHISYYSFSNRINITENTNKLIPYRLSKIGISQDNLQPPDIPVFLTYSNINNNLVIFWNNNNAQKYNIYKLTDATNYFLISNIYATTTADYFTDSNVDFSGNYTYYITAIDNQPVPNESWFSLPVIITFTNEPVYISDTIISNTNEITTDDNFITITPNPGYISDKIVFYIKQNNYKTVKLRILTLDGLIIKEIEMTLLNNMFTGELNNTSKYFSQGLFFVLPIIDNVPQIDKIQRLYLIY